VGRLLTTSAVMLEVELCTWGESRGADNDVILPCVRKEPTEFLSMRACCQNNPPG
jgi:hypothetical protein